MSEAEKRRKDRQELDKLFQAIEPAKNEDIARRAIAMAEYYLMKAENQAKHIQDLEMRNTQYERKRGRWIEARDEDPYYYICSECGHGHDFEDPFCPGCGAEMKEGEDV